VAGTHGAVGYGKRGLAVSMHPMPPTLVRPEKRRKEKEGRKKGEIGDG